MPPPHSYVVTLVRIPFSVAKDSTFLACCFAAIIPAYNAEIGRFHHPLYWRPSAVCRWGRSTDDTGSSPKRTTEAAIDFKERAHAVSYDLAAPSSTDEELLT